MSSYLSSCSLNSISVTIYAVSLLASKLNLFNWRQFLLINEIKYLTIAKKASLVSPVAPTKSSYKSFRYFLIDWHLFLFIDFFKNNENFTLQYEVFDLITILVNDLI